MAPPRILVLKTGTTFPGTRRRFGDYDRWFMDALRECNVRFESRDVTCSPPPPFTDYQGVLITGSPASVSDDPEWLGPLKEALREAVRQQRTPVLAVCFGAQVLASALGGRVVRNPRGWEMGTVRVRRTEAGREDRLLGAEADAVSFQATHQDIIEALPGDAVVLAGNRMCPIQAFRMGAQVWGMQFHPEVSPAILEDLLRARRELLEATAGGSSEYLALLAGLGQTPKGRELLVRFVELSGRFQNQQSP